MYNYSRIYTDRFTARLVEVNLASKFDIANFIEKTDFDDKLKNLY